MWLNGVRKARVQMKSKMVVLVAMLLIGVVAYASGAPWYRWLNLTDNMIVCAQNSPGEGWVQYKGPFSESRCVKPGVPE